MIVAWIWSILFYLGLDPIKWAMAYAMNEYGFRTRTLNRRRPVPPPEARPLRRPQLQPGPCCCLRWRLVAPLEDNWRCAPATRSIQPGPSRLHYVASALVAVHWMCLIVGLGVSM